MTELRGVRQVLYGRSTEQARLTGVLDAVEAGRGSSLALRGDVGIGRSALLDWAVDAAGDRGFDVLRVHGVQGEHGLAYGGLSQLVLPLRDQIARLLPPQAAALRSILGAGMAPESDEFLYGLATLSLLASAAERRPVLCVVDDLHWLDTGSMRALLFAARRLSADAVGVLLAVDSGFPLLPGIRELRLDALPTPAAEELLAGYDLDRPTRRRVQEEAEGNPLALHELAVMGGRFGDVAGPLPISDLVAAGFNERLSGLDEPSRLAVLVAAAEGHGHLGIVLAACHTLGLGARELAAAELAGVLRTADDRVFFGHPLVRGACYREAPLAVRSTVHRALADATGDPTCRGYHLWSAATGPDHATAEELWQAGEVAYQRRAYADAAMQYEWAARLTPAPDRRGTRLLGAATVALRTGQVERAAELADRAEPLLELAGDRVRLARVRASVELDRDRPDHAAGLLLRATELGNTAGMAGHGPNPRPPLTGMLAEAASYAFQAGAPELVRRAHDRADALGQPDDTTQALTALLDGDAEMGLPMLASVLRKATDEITQSAGTGPSVALPTDALAWGFLLGDATGTHHLASAILARARESGLLRPLPAALVARAQADLWYGRLPEARAALDEATTIIEDSCLWRRVEGLSQVRSQLAALTEDREDLDLDGWSGGLSAHARDAVRAAANQRDISRRRYPEVVRRVAGWLADSGGVGGPVPSAFGIVSLADGVQAASRTGQAGLAETWLDLLRNWAGANGLPWADGVLARAEAVNSEKERAYLSAIDRNAGSDRPFERARAELSYGEWLRRARRRSDARRPLTNALDTFERLRAVLWARHCREELRATGETLVNDRDLAENPLERLTPRELQVVRLAAEDASSEQIAAQLFLSRRTVEHHLYRAYRKLGVGSRRELGRLQL